MIGTTLNQRFTLEKELGRGGMGAVYRAVDQVLQRSVAIKLLRDKAGDELGRQIRLEAQILARLLHENVVRLYDFGEAGGMYYFVMEEVDGPSFARRWKRVPLAERLRMLAQVADALDYAHHQGVIHRDVKPANVLMTSLDQAKLTDFGLSLVVDEAQVAGVIKGTPHYMSPEQARGKRIDHRADLYSLGVMMYECATGTPPFQGPTMAVIAGHVGGVIDPPRTRNPAISAELESYILRLLSRAPDARPHSGAEVAASIRDLIARDPSIRDAPAGQVGGGFASLTPPTIHRAGSIGRASASLDAHPNGSESGLETTGSASRMVEGFAAPAGPAIDRPGAPEKGAIAAGLDRARAASMIADVVLDPITLSAEERYLSGHYLGYLLGGSRRQGFFRRRPLDPLNADRARLILGMTWLMTRGADQASISRAADLLESRYDVRPLLSPIVVAKYLGVRDTAAKRKAFREARRLLQDASGYARRHMTDTKGVLNPGLMPQVLADLRKVAPAREDVDDQLVGRWNRVAEVWRGRPEFRQAVLAYATTSAWRDPDSAELWPEVVYPLIERARWQRSLRSNSEAIWDHVCELLRLPDAGVKLDRAITKVVPAQVIEQLDLSMGAFEDDPQLDADINPAEDPSRPPGGLGGGIRLDGASFHDLETDLSPAPRGLVRLASPDPVRLTMGDLRELWQEALNALKVPGARAGGGHRVLPIGIYRLAVIPSIRGKSAGQVAIQGMRDKQIEMLIPSIRLASNASKPILAAWTYQDDSLAIAYVDYRATERFISWHAPTNQQVNHDDAAGLNGALLRLGLEAPDQLDRVLSKRFRPRNPV